MAVETFPTRLLSGTPHETELLSRFVEPFTGPAPTVVTFAGSRVDSMGPDYRFIGDRLAEQHACYSTSWDLPAHGDDVRLTDPPVSALAVWRARAEAGEPFLTNFVTRSSAVLDAMVAAKFTDRNKIVLVGHSRGALAALRIAAVYPVAAVVALSPVADLLKLEEWVSASPALAAPLGVMAVAPQLTNTKIHWAIGSVDNRVSTEASLAVAQQLCAWSAPLTLQVFPDVFPGHGPTPLAVLEHAAAWVVEQLQ